MTSGTEALFAACMAFCEAGDEVVMFEPVSGPFQLAFALFRGAQLGAIGAHNFSFSRGISRVFDWLVRLLKL